ncbi:hypothetical protein [Actinoplanes sp. NBRC 101535]|uniref:hypothetical protein n=1 Tax=Actinoplanes sp. NBRC 101535 TaxID=3032196 RepID=UPI0024A01443|nr:hypothetical protein [Actinoplanes sp. NBRC 101535]GLY06702.1 hypothetical protein Acsp01_70810 [Actinoplanes sp. NBRC 101535]
MTADVLSELYRILTVRSSWISILGFAFLGVATAWFSPEFWSMFAGMGGFGVAALTTAQHYQHRTVVLLLLGRPRRVRALIVQSVTAALLTIPPAAVSGLAVLRDGTPGSYLWTLAAVPVMAVFGVAGATVVRRPVWLLAGWGLWLLVVEGLLGQLDAPLPFSAYLSAAAGDRHGFGVLLLWAGAGFLAGAVSIRRDLSGD